MKTNSASASLIKIIALIMAIVMCFAACGDKEDVSSTQDASGTASTNENEEVESKSDEPTDVSETESVADASDKEQTTDNAESNKDTAVNTSKTTTTQNNNNNKDNNKTPSKNQATNNNQTVTNTKTTWDKDWLSTMPEEVKKKGVTLLMWRYLLPTEKKLIQDFEKKTGCKVTIVETNETEYSTKLISLIAGKASPDVVNLGSDAFPARAVKAMIPLDKATFRLDDGCWDKTSMENVRIGNNYYGVAMPKTWNCSDTHYVTFYQPSVLKACGVTSMPYDLWKQGKWNWDAQQQIAQKIAAANRGYSAISMQSSDLMMLASGADFVSYNGKEYSNSAKNAKGNSVLVKSWQATTKLVEAGYVTGWDLTQVKNGKTGLFTTISYGLYSEADWAFNKLPGGAESVNAVPVAAETQSGAYVPYRPKNWGVAKGAKNPEGAAYFLRYYLDSENCDFDSTFLNSQCKEIFNFIIGKNTKRKARIGQGVIDFVSANNYANMLSRISNATSANVTTEINANVGTVEAAVKRVNKEVEKAQ